jgi:hypothetical protein
MNQKLYLLGLTSAHENDILSFRGRSDVHVFIYSLIKALLTLDEGARPAASEVLKMIETSKFH